MKSVKKMIVKALTKKKESKAGKKGDEKLHKMAVKRHKKDKVKKVMTEFKDKDLHSGSKTGPIVTKPKQAIAIALSESRKIPSKKKKKK